MEPKGHQAVARRTTILAVASSWLLLWTRVTFRNSYDLSFEARASLRTAKQIAKKNASIRPRKSLSGNILFSRFSSLVQQKERELAGWHFRLDTLVTNRISQQTRFIKRIAKESQVLFPLSCAAVA
jgi:hypothetical protein